MGCGRSRPKSELRRFVLAADRVVPDPGGRAAGRGAYLCPSDECAEAARRRGGFQRSFRARVEVAALHTGDRVQAPQMSPTRID